jgi:glyoxylase-like metal-dependent hydrolase (beta-lactamase superfamily II)
MIRIGDLQIHIIQESILHMDAGGAFGLVPRALFGRLMPPAADNTVAMPNHCLLVQTDGRNILIDVGVGDKMPEKARLALRHEQPLGTMHDALQRLGLTVSDIDLVINTHLHNDHCGGNTRYGADGAPVAVFPNAEYVVQRREYEDAMFPNERTRATYLPENYAPLVERGQMRLLEGDAVLAPGVTGVVTPGHTPGHMSVMLESGGEYGLFVCDLSSFAIHFERLGWMTAYDVEPLVTLESKRRWQAWAASTQALLFFAHDPQRPAGRFRFAEAGRGEVIAQEITYA